MAIKGLIGKEDATLGTPEIPWKAVYTEKINSSSVELTEEHLTNYTFEGKPVYELVFPYNNSNTTGATTKVKDLSQYNIDTVIFFSTISLNGVDDESSARITPIPLYISSENHRYATYSFENEGINEGNPPLTRISAAQPRAVTYAFKHMLQL